MNAALHAPLSRQVAQSLGSAVRSLKALQNSSLSENFLAHLADGRAVFIKSQRAERHRHLLAEVDGLRWLAAVECDLLIPEVLAFYAGDEQTAAFLAMPYLQPERGSPEQQARLGRGLAALHRTRAEHFGLPQDNYLANLPQENRPLPDWATFHIERRLQPMAKRARDCGQLSKAACAALEQAYPRILARTASAEPPAHLHGDLWSGNVLFTSAGPALIDPAVYGGHREVDLAMMHLFGGFAGRCFGAYEEVYPLTAGARERRPLYQLYPLLVHVVLFGGSYAAQLQSIVDGI